MPEAQAKENTSRIIPMTADDLIYLQLKDLKDEFRDSRKELNARMDRIENRQDKLEAKLETTRQELIERIDKVDAKIDATRKELNARMDKQDEKIDKLDEKIDRLEEKFDAKFDKLAEKIDSATKHGNIMTATVIGIALGVLYVIFFK